MGGHNEENVKLGKGLRLFFSAFAHYKWQVLFLLIILTLSECAAIVDKFLLKYFIDYATQYTAGTVTRDYFFGVGLTIVFIFIGVYIFRIFSRWVIGIRSNHISANMIMEFKAKAYKHLLHLPQSFHTSNKTGTIISKLMRTNSAVEGMSDVFIYSLVPIIIQIVMVIGSLFVINLTSAVIIILYVAAFLGYSYFIQLRQIKPQVAYNHAEDLEKGFIADTFTNIEPIKLFGKEEYMYNRFGMFISSSKNKLLHFWKYWISSDVGLVAITGTATIAMLLFTGNAYFTGAIDLGSLVFIYTVFVSMVGPLSSFQWGMRGLYRSLGDFESLRSYLDVKNDIVDVSHAPALWISSGQVVFKDVVFHYSKKQVFEKMNLTVPAKKTVALVGKSGSGKSTLVKLLFRLYDIEEGSILIDGTSIRDVQQSSLRSSMSVVPQECILFDDTLYNNILF
ncbi:MAG TPA: ABC transporter ATP-binding protein, partial [Acidobacteriota bacterium]|nr:ABC transporter ATP-binding protein [Acidobacteriota bacterium]